MKYIHVFKEGWRRCWPLSMVLDILDIIKMWNISICKQRKKWDSIIIVNVQIYFSKGWSEDCFSVNLETLQHSSPAQLILCNIVSIRACWPKWTVSWFRIDQQQESSRDEEILVVHLVLVYVWNWWLTGWRYTVTLWCSLSHLQPTAVMFVTLQRGMGLTGTSHCEPPIEPSHSHGDGLVWTGAVLPAGHRQARSRPWRRKQWAMIWLV